MQDTNQTLFLAIFAHFLIVFQRERFKHKVWGGLGAVPGVAAFFKFLNSSMFALIFQGSEPLAVDFLIVFLIGPLKHKVWGALGGPQGGSIF